MAKKVKEYHMRCKVCGNIFCYTSRDLSNNTLNEVSTLLSSGASILSAFAGSKYDMYEQNKLSERSSNKIVDYSKCPNCNSKELEEISEEEWQDLQDEMKTPAKDIKINSNASISSLEKRVENFLEDKSWVYAKAYCEHILDMEPQNAKILFYKILANKRASSMEDLINRYISISNEKEVEKIIKTGNKTYIKKIETIDKKIKENRYNVLVNQAKSTDIELELICLSEEFEKYGDYKESKELSQYCLYKAAVAYLNTDDMKNLAIAKNLFMQLDNYEDSKNYLYELAIKYLDYEDIANINEAKEIFTHLDNYKDSKKKIKECNKKISSLQEKKEKNKKIFIIVGIISIVVIFICIICSPSEDEVKLSEISSALEAGNYEKAIDLSEELESEKAKDEYVKLYSYALAKDYIDDGKYESAIEELEKCISYKDSDKLLKQCKEEIYNEVKSLMKQNKYDEAVEKLYIIEDFKDSKDLIKTCEDNSTLYKNYILNYLCTDSKFDKNKLSYFMDNEYNYKKEEIDEFKEFMKEKTIYFDYGCNDVVTYKLSEENELVPTEPNEDIIWKVSSSGLYYYPEGIGTTKYEFTVRRLNSKYLIAYANNKWTPVLIYAEE